MCTEPQRILRDAIVLRFHDPDVPGDRERRHKQCEEADQRDDEERVHL